MSNINARVRWAGLAACLLLVVVFAQLNYLQIFRADALDHNPLNSRGVVLEYAQPRGAIISADGVTLAESVPSHDQYKYQRKYPQGSLFGQITGYYSLIYGTDGLENEYGPVLAQRNASVPLPTDLKQIKNFFINQPAPDDLRTTVLASLQKVAANELAGRDGAVVALVPRTGAILAMYANPSYNPQPLADHSQAKEVEAWRQLNAAKGQPLVSAAYRQRFFPGSTFKVITSSAVYDHEPALAQKSIPFSTGLVLPDTAGQVLHNYAGESCGGNLLQLFTVSCDTGFAQLGLDIGANNLYQEARRFGWDRTTPIDMPYPAQSSFPAPATFYRNGGALAKSAIGQESVQAVPLTMALDAGAIADGGVIMTPHLMQEVTGSQDQVVAKYQDKVWLRATSQATAAQVTQLMLSVVNNPKGTGTAARIPGIQVAGKTGTAETGGPYIETWFVAFAPVPNPKIAVAVLVENQPIASEYQGGTIAAPIARAVIQAYLQNSKHQ
ncbi:MAG TPA: penicillin-binding transpeptidase domain-containing protein [Acidimicrobiales bacterium]|nr:penicillin-binding transpeptidase domain-containing protein [Acidimicrobiales bacterium]